MYKAHPQDQSTSQPRELQGWLTIVYQGINQPPTNSPALINVKPGLLADLNHTPAPQRSHHARVISLPLSAFCVYVLGSGLVVSMSAVCTKRWAECLLCAPRHVSPGMMPSVISILVLKGIWAVVVLLTLRRPIFDSRCSLVMNVAGQLAGVLTCNGQRLLSLTA